MASKTIRRGVGIAALVLLAAAVVWALRPAPVPVETAVVARAPLTARVVAEGRVRVKDVYLVAAPVDGDLDRIAVEPGDEVQPGAVAARIWPVTPRPLDARSRAEAEATVAAARATVARAEATQKEAAGALVHADSQLNTTRELVRGSAAAKNDLEHAEHEVQIRREALDAARAAVQAARADLQRAEAVVATGMARPSRAATVVAAPVSGRVLRLLRESAGPVAAGTPLLEIGNTADLEVTADLLTVDAMSVRPGAAAEIRDWGGAGAIPARVRRVDPAAFTKVSALGLEEQRVRAVLDLVGPPPGGMGHDFRVTAAIDTWHGEDVIAVPSTALFRTGDAWAVFVVQDGRAALTVVTPGPSDGTRTAIERGLEAGQAIVIQPSDLITDGARVAEIRR
jgi:HlyD family secretion protein